MAGGYLWVLMAVSVLAPVVGGFFLGRFAMSRSRDAFETGKWAFLCFIPLLAFLLFLARTRHENSPNRVPAIPLLSGGLGVITGFVFLAATGFVTVFVQQQERVMEQQAKNDPNSMATGMEFLIRSDGLEKTLQTMAAQFGAPVRVDEVTTLSRIVAVGTQLQRTYSVDRQNMELIDEFRSQIRSGICAISAFAPIFRAGGSIREIYVEKNGREIGAVMVTARDCGF